MSEAVSESLDHVVDTHALVWHLTDAPELSSRARTILEDADQGNRAIIVPSIVLVEVVYLVEKGRLQVSVFNQIVSYLNDFNRPYHEQPLDILVVEALRRVPRTAVPEMPDRIIAATARSLGYPLISVDQQIHASGVIDVVW